MDSVTQAEVKLEIKKETLRLEEKFNSITNKLKDEQHRMAIAFTEQTGYLQRIAENTEGMKARMESIESKLDKLDDRLGVVENEYELKKDNRKGKWELLKALLGAGGVLTIVAAAVIQLLGGFPFN